MSTATATPDAAATADADLLALAAEADASGPDYVPPAPTSTAPETLSPSAASDESARPAAGADGKPPLDPKAKPAEAPKPGEAKTDDPKPADAKPETAFQKAQKEKARLEKTWANVEKEKEQVRAEAARIQQERAAFEKERAELETLRKQVASAPRGPVKDEAGYTAADYDKAAEAFTADGDTRLAAAAKGKAEALRAKEKEAAASAPAAGPVVEPWKTPEFQQKWNAEAAAIVKAEPALGDPENPVFKTVDELVNRSPWAPLLRSQPNGLRAAVEVAKLQTAAARVPTLEKELAAARAEVERLNKLTAPRGGPPAAPAPGQKRLEDMNPEEADAQIRAMAAAADQGGA